MYIDDKPTDDYWLQNVYSTLFKIYYARWKVRNQTQHGPNDEYTKQALLLRISALYALKDNMHPQDQHCFRKPLKDWDYMTSTDMKKWLHTYTLHIKQCMALEKSRLKTHTHDIRNWMKPKQNKNDSQALDHLPHTPTRIRNTQASIMQFFRKTGKQIQSQR